MSRSIFFLHNPKAGGSSLRTIFGKLFSADEIAPTFSNAPAEHRRCKSRLNGYKGYGFYAGHYGYDVFQQLQDRHLLVTNFRDPVARIVSLYRYWRNNVRVEDLAGAAPEDAAVVMLSKDLDFSRFVRCDDRNLLLYISNFHFRQLAHSGWEPLRASYWDRLKVKRRIRQMPWFYVAEMPHISSLLLKRTFPELDAGIPRENHSQGDGVSISSEDIERIVRLNDLDFDIFYYALRLQSRRFRRLR